jgi:NAD(P)-dependent dehydrogenase (short-subunit alcohol dehydrogenase family)
MSTDSPVLLITGASTGIGAATARLAAEAGYRLVLGARSEDKLRGLAEELGGDERALAVRCDVTEWADQQALVQTALDAFGGIDVAFANAGIEIAHTARAVPLVEMERIADINFTGVFRTVRATLPQVIERRGYVLITASLAAVLHGAPLSHYSATKAGVEAFGNAIRMELRHKGVDVGVAYFGFIDTPMLQRGKSDPILAKFEEQQGRNFIGKTYPLSDAGAAVLNGIENRTRRVMYPRWIRPLYALRSLMPRLIDRAVDAQMVGRLVDELDERDLQSTEQDVSRELHDRLLS